MAVQSPMNIVFSDGFDAGLFESFKKNSTFNTHPKSKLTPAELDTILPTTHALIVRSSTKVDAALLAKAPELKLVIRAGEGVDNIDLKACLERDVVVENTPGANNNSAAEHALALMMSLQRWIPQAHKKLHGQGVWDKNSYTGNELWKKKIGIVGMGRIGQLLAQRLSGFDAEILFFDPFVKTAPFPHTHPAKDLEQVFKDCEAISIHVPLMPETKNLITKKHLDLMSKNSILVNASRGGIVNEQDLFSHLKEGKIRGAALDVFQTEPLEGEHQWQSLENVILTPHLGASTHEAQFRVGEMTLQQIEQFFLHQKIVHHVKPRN